MFKNVFLLIAVAVISVSVAVPKAQAIDLSDALARMNEIIAEMEKLKNEFTSLALSANGTTNVSSNTTAQPSDVFTHSLQYGDTNDDIKKIQALLATDVAIYPYGAATGFFGPKTQEAITNFQARFGLDTVGVVGPATRALLSLFIAAYPDGNYPASILKERPQTTTTNTNTTNSNTSVTNNPARYIDAEYDRGEYTIKIKYTNGNTQHLIVEATTEEQAITQIASRTTLTKAQIRAVIDFEAEDEDGKDSDIDEDDADDMIDDADDVIDDVRDEIEEADDDGEDVDWAEDTLEEAEELLEEAEDAFDDEDYEEAYELAEEAMDLAEEAEDRIGEDENGQKGDSDEIESIEAEVEEEDETNVTIEYEDGSEYEFTVEEYKKDEIIEEIADELDIDEDDVEDLIEFDYGDLDEIEVLVDEDENEAKVSVTYESGVEIHFTIDADDEDDMIEEIADELDIDEDDVEDVIDFDYV